MGVRQIIVLLGILCTAVSIQGQNDESAAIIQTSSMQFRVTGNAANNFTQQAQTDFSNNLRTLLNPYNFMSVAVSDYQAHQGYVDVDVRAVIATDATNLTSTYSRITNQTLSGTFASAFNALLTNSGILMNATVLSISGATTAAGTNVDFGVKMVLTGGSNLKPFTQDVQSKFLTPINSFLGDHGNASIGAYTETADGVNIDLNTTLDANTMPQYFFFLSNTSTLQSSLPGLGGSSLTVTVGNATAYGSSSPPAASGPAALKALAPAPVASSRGAVTAQEATGISAIPPVTSSSSGTVTMNVDMTIFGSDIVPFDATKQYATSSSLASVFWIIVGTGSVNLVTFSSYNATGRPSNVALGTTQQYGRKLLQSTTPAENVTFAVTLPTASQNSLLVLQSNSDKVTQQFAGWFVTQMASRGLTVDAAVNRVSLSGVSTQASPTPPSSPSGSSSSSTSSSTSKGSGSNLGAILGGVLGGVFGALLLALLAFFLIARSRKNKKAAQKTKRMESSSSDGFNGTVYWEPTKPVGPSPIYTKDADALKKTIATMLTTKNSFDSYDSKGFFHSPLHSRLTEVDSNHAESIKSLVQRKQQESQQTLETTSYKAEILLSYLSSLQMGTLFYSKYVVEKSQRKGMYSVIAYASLREEPSTKVVIKFLPGEERYIREKLFYENRQALEGETATAYIPFMLDAFEGVHDTSTRTHTDSDIPSSIVLQRGSFTLAEYLMGKADLTERPEAVNKSDILGQLCACVNFMHARHLVHGSLTTDHVMWFPAEKKWKIAGFGNWARSGENMRVDYDLRYAAPELVLADLARMATIPAKESVDMWALGCIAYELLSGRVLFGPEFNDEEIMAMLLGYVKLPWESNPDFFVDTLAPSARTFVSSLLMRSPEARKPIATALHAPLLAGSQAPYTTGPVTELRTPNNLNSVMSDW